MKKSMKKTKVLYFVDILEYAGIQNFIVNIINNVKNTDIEILTLDDGNTYPLEKELTNKGIKVYKLKDVWLKGLFSYIKYRKQVNIFFNKHHDYKIVHLHSTSKNYYILKIAKKYDIDIRIAHSHSTDFYTSKILKRIIGNLWKNKLLKYATDYMACSKEAGEWLFPNKKFIVIPNGIETDKFKYNDLYRKELIKEYNLENKFIIGNVGRLTYQKNPLLLIDIFNEIKKENNNSFLIIIGTGELEDKVKEKINDYKLNNSILLLNNRNDVYKFYNVFDCFILPSLHEGFCIAILEAQINGLPCIVNKDVIPKDVIISKNLIEVEKDNIKEYKKNVLKSKRIKGKINSNYDIKNIVKELEEFYQRR